MRRFSLGRLMLLVAFLGANFAVLNRLLQRLAAGTPDDRSLLAGLLPLADAVLIASWRLAGRWRVSIRLRPRGERGGFDGWFAAVAGILLVGLLAASVGRPDSLKDYVDWAAIPLGRVLNDTGIELSNDAVVYGVLTPFLFVVISGPPLMLSPALAFALSRFQVVVTPREVPCADSPSWP